MRLANKNGAENEKNGDYFKEDLVFFSTDDSPPFSISSTHFPFVWCNCVDNSS